MQVRPPSRNGIGPSCVALPPGPWPSLLDFLVERFSAIGRAVWMQRMACGLLLNAQGAAITSDQPYQPHTRVYYYREVLAEPPIAFQAQVIYQDEHLLVADKPHFLPVVPSGGYLNETLLVRLKQQLGVDDLVPLHRLDRDTAGLVLFCKQAASRGAYSALFRQHAVQKTYHAIAPYRPDLLFPITRHSRIRAAGHFMLQHEVDGPINAITQIEVLEVRGALARYQLKPVTGQRHQLRVHMLALGLPLLHDGLYPTLTPEGSIDLTRPLQLLAKELAFTDPVTGQAQHFVSQRSLLF